MGIQITDLWVTQRRLRQPEQVEEMVTQVKEGGLLPYIQIDEMEDGSLQVGDGHHRLTALWLAGVRVLSLEHYELLPSFGKRGKRRYGQFPDVPWLS